MEKSRVALDVEIPSDVSYIEEVVELAARKCRELHLPDSKCSLNLRVALSEAIANAILRGNGDAANRHVRVRAVVREDAVVIDVIDDGPGFDLSAKRPDPTLPEHLEREEGRGLFLMQVLMDRVERFESGGNVVRLTLLRE